MKKVTAIIGTQTRRNTYRAVQEFEKNLKLGGEIDFEYLFLSDYHLEFCRGCKVLLKGSLCRTMSKVIKEAGNIEPYF